MHRILCTEAEFNNKNNLKEVLISAYALQIMLDVTKIKGMKYVNKAGKIKKFF